MSKAAARISAGTLGKARMEGMDALLSEDGGEAKDEPEDSELGGEVMDEFKDSVMRGEDVKEAGGEGSADRELGRITGLILGVVGAEFEGEMYFTGM
ncbi:hypothetical protein BGZ70_004146 [Mortierella alpina]|uniref:Uncharacterized protein n=1 Tax=Mortierella alpina TaxID=64518 RepID=A0A9P6LVD8_MORAP|nr:hypothetical protein BGZ70_004146 [Mortierella alpina]